jgi:hypothetical protein
VGGNSNMQGSLTHIKPIVLRCLGSRLDGDFFINIKETSVILKNLNFKLTLNYDKSVVGFS